MDSLGQMMSTDEIVPAIANMASATFTLIKVMSPLFIPFVVGLTVLRIATCCIGCFVGVVCRVMNGIEYVLCKEARNEDSREMTTEWAANMAVMPRTVLLIVLNFLFCQIEKMTKAVCIILLKNVYLVRCFILAILFYTPKFFIGNSKGDNLRVVCVGQYLKHVASRCLKTGAANEVGIRRKAIMENLNSSLAEDEASKDSDIVVAEAQLVLHCNGRPVSENGSESEIMKLYEAPTRTENDRVLTKHSSPEKISSSRNVQVNACCAEGTERVTIKNGQDKLSDLDVGLTSQDSNVNRLSDVSTQTVQPAAICNEKAENTIDQKSTSKNVNIVNSIQGQGKSAECKKPVARNNGDCNNSKNSPPTTDADSKKSNSLVSALTAKLKKLVFKGQRNEDVSIESTAPVIHGGSGDFEPSLIMKNSVDETPGSQPSGQIQNNNNNCDISEKEEQVPDTLIQRQEHAKRPTGTKFFYVREPRFDRMNKTGGTSTASGEPNDVLTCKPAQKPPCPWSNQGKSLRNDVFQTCKCGLRDPVEEANTSLIKIGEGIQKRKLGQVDIIGDSVCSEARLAQLQALNSIDIVPMRKSHSGTSLIDNLKSIDHFSHNDEDCNNNNTTVLKSRNVQFITSVATDGGKMTACRDRNVPPRKSSSDANLVKNNPDKNKEFQLMQHMFDPARLKTADSIRSEIESRKPEKSSVITYRNAIVTNGDTKCAEISAQKEISTKCKDVPANSFTSDKPNEKKPHPEKCDLGIVSEVLLPLSPTHKLKLAIRDTSQDIHQDIDRFKTSDPADMLEITSEIVPVSPDHDVDVKQIPSDDSITSSEGDSVLSSSDGEGIMDHLADLLKTHSELNLKHLQCSRYNRQEMDKLCNVFRSSR